MVESQRLNAVRWACLCLQTAQQPYVCLPVPEALSFHIVCPFTALAFHHSLPVRTPPVPSGFKNHRFLQRLASQHRHPCISRLLGQVSRAPSLIVTF